ncbi:hypothetical protein M231_05126 [Tremella mesenterica]|uniref:Uncharacterized protein n=1 Tax=Tremella mesenterica TaxID=5217 RepID=A0A4Q1BIU2_TREME|nr:hypothetical protein M231_05126 [Tremella mesenterica]
MFKRRLTPTTPVPNKNKNTIDLSDGILNLFTSTKNPNLPRPPRPELPLSQNSLSPHEGFHRDCILNSHLDQSPSPDNTLVHNTKVDIAPPSSSRSLEVDNEIGDIPSSIRRRSTRISPSSSKGRLGLVLAEEKTCSSPRNLTNDTSPHLNSDQLLTTNGPTKLDTFSSASDTADILSHISDPMVHSNPQVTLSDLFLPTQESTRIGQVDEMDVDEFAGISEPDLLEDQDQDWIWEKSDKINSSSKQIPSTIESNLPLTPPSPSSHIYSSPVIVTSKRSSEIMSSPVLPPLKKSKLANRQDDSGRNEGIPEKGLYSIFEKSPYDLKERSDQAGPSKSFRRCGRTNSEMVLSSDDESIDSCEFFKSPLGSSSTIQIDRGVSDLRKRWKTKSDEERSVGKRRKMLVSGEEEDFGESGRRRVLPDGEVGEDNGENVGFQVESPEIALSKIRRFNFGPKLGVDTERERVGVGKEKERVGAGKEKEEERNGIGESRERIKVKEIHEEKEQIELDEEEYDFDPFPFPLFDQTILSSPFQPVLQPDDSQLPSKQISGDETTFLLSKENQNDKPKPTLEDLFKDDPPSSHHTNHSAETSSYLTKIPISHHLPIHSAELSSFSTKTPISHHLPVHSAETSSFSTKTPISHHLPYKEKGLEDSSLFSKTPISHHFPYEEKGSEDSSLFSETPISRVFPNKEMGKLKDSSRSIRTTPITSHLPYANVRGMEDGSRSLGTIPITYDVLNQEQNEREREKEKEKEKEKERDRVRERERDREREKERERERGKMEEEEEGNGSFRLISELSSKEQEFYMFHWRRGAERMVSTIDDGGVEELENMAKKVGISGRGGASLARGSSRGGGGSRGGRGGKRGWFGRTRGKKTRGRGKTKT